MTAFVLKHLESALKAGELFVFCCCVLACLWYFGFKHNRQTAYSHEMQNKWHLGILSFDLHVLASAKRDVTAATPRCKQSVWLKCSDTHWTNSWNVELLIGDDTALLHTLFCLVNGSILSAMNNCGTSSNHRLWRTTSNHINPQNGDLAYLRLLCCGLVLFFSFLYWGLLSH